MVSLATVHDMAEAVTGDIAPSHGISKEDKHKMEEDAMHTLTRGYLDGDVAGRRIHNLWLEYEAQETPEARYVKDLGMSYFDAQDQTYLVDHQ